MAFNLSKYTNDPETTMTKMGSNSYRVDLSDADEKNTKLIQALKKDGFKQHNSYLFTKDSLTLDKAIRACDRSGIHQIEYLDIDGNKQKETIKGDASKVNSRVEELKRHGCKITKTNMFMNWS